ncbi:geminin [Battus philenor]|uniref:geminin n=1 Tax=Battus philenor TaxID=42288 RepID=UPI0035D08F29
MSSQDVPRTTRRSLKTLQHTAIDRENLVGRPSKSLKHQLTQETPVEVGVKRKNISSKETQVNLESNVTARDLTDPDGPSEKYWEILAKKREVALEEAFEENEKLRKIIEDLKQENSLYKQMLDEANSFVEVIKEELANSSKDDTGIDVNDVSQCEEATEGETSYNADENDKKDE